MGMMEKAADIRTVPYFWTAMFGKSIRYAGEEEAHTVHLRTDNIQASFLVFLYYLQINQVHSHRTDTKTV